MGEFSRDLKELQRISSLLQQDNLSEQDLISLRSITISINKRYLSYINLLSKFDRIKKTTLAIEFQKNFESLANMNSQGYFSRGIDYFKKVSSKAALIVLIPLVSLFSTVSYASLDLSNKFSPNPVFVKYCEERFSFTYKPKPEPDLIIDFEYVNSDTKMSECFLELLYANKEDLEKFLTTAKEIIKSTVPKMTRINERFTSSLDVSVDNKYVRASGHGKITKRDGKTYLEFDGYIDVGENMMRVKFQDYEVFEVQ